MDKGMNVSYEIICDCGRKLSDLDVAGGICPWCHRVVDGNVRKIIMRNTEVVGSQLVNAPERVIVTQPQKDSDAIFWIVGLFFYLMNPLLAMILLFCHFRSKAERGER